MDCSTIYVHMPLLNRTWSTREVLPPRISHNFGKLASQNLLSLQIHGSPPTFPLQTQTAWSSTPHSTPVQLHPSWWMEFVACGRCSKKKKNNEHPFVRTFEPSTSDNERKNSKCGKSIKAFTLTETRPPFPHPCHHTASLTCYAKRWYEKKWTYPQECIDEKVTRGKQTHVGPSAPVLPEDFLCACQWCRHHQHLRTIGSQHSTHSPRMNNKKKKHHENNPLN